ncbi:MAG TPA: hypothetical protein VGL65_10190 [Gemmatimonadales bacterium]|jgi:hypothetical protein
MYLLLHFVLSLLPQARWSPHPPACISAQTGRLVPSQFVGGRIFALLHVKDRGDLRLYTDTGGGGVWLYPEAVQRAGLPVDTLRRVRDTTHTQTELTPHALSVVDPRLPRHRAASFIGAERFEQWHARHPEWLVVQKAEAGADSASMIRVPSITVGGRTIGPVWFTERPTSSFGDFISQYTDRPVEGALGGSAWRYVTLIVDYPRRRAAVLARASK